MSLQAASRTVNGAALSAALLIILPGCGDEPPTGDRSIASSNQYTAAVQRVPTEIVYEGDELALPHYVEIIDGHLIITDPYVAPHLHVLRIRDGMLVRSFGVSGEGPGEYEFPSGIIPDLVRDTLWIGDPANGRISGIAWDDVLDDGELPDPRTIRFQLPFRQLLRGPDGQFLVVDASGLSRFVAVSPEGGIESRTERPPVDTDLPPAIAGLAYLDFVSVHPSGALAAAAAVWGGALATVDIATGSTIDSADVPIAFSPDVGWAQGDNGLSFSPNESTRQGYVDVIATEGFIVGLFSGRRLWTYGREARWGEDLHLFDWHGSLLGVYRLDTPLVSIAYESETRAFYGVRLDTAPAIVRFTLGPVEETQG